MAGRSLGQWGDGAMGWISLGVHDLCMSSQGLGVKIGESALSWTAFFRFGLGCLLPDYLRPRQSIGLAATCTVLED